jgi:alkanesulfonate monooxygenase SsuD/methylene tetrahydromethanopterin reductase-like flavin-dependent oxidoreductase (luciferase family)
MKFMLHLTPAVPASPIERERLRPIAHRTDKTQQMIDEMVELAQLAEELGFSAVTYSEHHFYTEGLKAGATPTPHLMNLLHHTKRIKVGPVGFVLPTWDPIRLALDAAWADQMSRGRVLVGLARGVFEELFNVMKLSWGEEPFSFNGRFYKVPVPAEGLEWLPHEATARYGAPGELEGNRVRKISPVPKPYQKPHPPLFMALTTSEETIRWSAREGVVPLIFLPFPEMAIKGAQFYTDEATKAGHALRLGQNIGMARLMYLGETREEARQRAQNGAIFLFRQFHAKFIPQIPTTIEPFIDAGLAFTGTVADVRGQMLDVQEQLNPEWFMVLCDQGFMPLHEVKKQIEMFGTKIMPEFMG